LCLESRLIILPRLLSFYFPPTPAALRYPLSLHDALPISQRPPPDGDEPLQIPRQLVPADVAPHRLAHVTVIGEALVADLHHEPGDRKSTRLNSSHVSISYAVFCLKKKI